MSPPVKRAERTTPDVRIAALVGTFRPLQGLSAFDGKLATGTWTLEVRDTVKKQTGTLNSWSLGITG